MKEIVYMSTTHYILIPVVVKKYTERVSLKAFCSRVLKACYEHRPRNLRAYESSFIMKDKAVVDYERSVNDEKLIDELVVIKEQDPITVSEYYDLVCYDYKKKKINGMTMKKYVKRYIDLHPGW